ncbi:MAG TPA: helix-turn-helix domain-containing protein [Candidatus Binataceae bacterium]|jgi:transcriptional regulator with XRE-family HTH domain
MREAQLRRFGKLIQNHRRRLFLSLEDMASVAGITTTLLRQLEAGKSHPSESVVAKLAKALELKLGEELHLQVAEDAAVSSESSWNNFLREDRLHRIYNITETEMQTLSGVALMGTVRDSQDFIFILNTIRKAVADSTDDAEQ